MSEKERWDMMRREHPINVFGYGHMNMEEDGYRIKGFESMDRTSFQSGNSTLRFF